MVQNDEHFLDRSNCLLDVGNWNTNFVRDLLPGLINVLNLIDVELARVRPKFVPNFFIDPDVDFGLEELHGALESISVRSGSAVHQPRNSLQADAYVDHLHLQFLAGAVVERLVLHEYHVAHLKTSHEVLNGWSKIATAGPDIFNEGDFVGMDF